MRFCKKTGRSNTTGTTQTPPGRGTLMSCEHPTAGPRLSHTVGRCACVCPGGRWDSPSPPAPSCLSGHKSLPLGHRTAQVQASGQWPGWFAASGSEARGGSVLITRACVWPQEQATWYSGCSLVQSFHAVFTEEKRQTWSAGSCGLSNVLFRKLNYSLRPWDFTDGS